MQHLNEEELVARYYADAEASESAESHLSECAECAARYDVLSRVLALVKDAPVPDRGEEYGSEVWNRLRWKLGTRQSRPWKSMAAIAAMIAIAFFAGLLWRSDDVAAPGTVTPRAAATAGGTVDRAEARERLVLVVLGDHLEDSERVLVEIANADPRREVTVEGNRAYDLVTANRIYRQTAAQRGDERIATLLSDLEPILIELSNAGATLEGKKLTEIQKRIESKGLLFKVRVMGAQAAEQIRPTTPEDSL